MTSVERKKQTQFLKAARIVAHRLDKEKRMAIAPNVVEALRCIDPKTIPRKVSAAAKEIVVTLYIGAKNGTIRI